MNALCTFSSGQLIRGDAILTTVLQSPAQAQSWVDSLTMKSFALNAPTGAWLRSDSLAGENVSASALDNQKHSTQPELACSSDAESERAPPPDAQASPSLLGLAEHAKSSGDAQQPTTGRATAARQQGHAATAEDSSEPRTRLLWSIVGQASSVDWRDRPAGRGTPPCESSLQANLQLLREANPQGQTAARCPPSRSLLPAFPCRDAAACQGEPSTVRMEENELLAKNADEAKHGNCDLNPRDSRDEMSNHMWADLQPELLALIARKCRTGAPLQSMVSTCRLARGNLLTQSLVMELEKAVDDSDVGSCLPGSIASVTFLDHSYSATQNCLWHLACYPLWPAIPCL